MTDIAHDVAPTTRDRLSQLAPLLDALAAVAIRGEVPGPELLARVAQARPVLCRRSGARLPNDGEPYSRSILRVDDEVEIMVARWRPGHRCAPHDHGGSGGFVVAVEGTFQERRFGWEGTQLVVAETTTRPEGEAIRDHARRHPRHGRRGGRAEPASVQPAGARHAAVRHGTGRGAGTGRRLRRLDPGGRSRAHSVCRHRTQKPRQRR